jgi:phenylalanyl-tRNA synthetase beta chain
MTISYNWLHEYLPLTLEPERLSHILTAIGLEVESMEPFEAVKGSLNGLVIGEVLEATPHPNADKLRLTKVSTGNAPLQIVCGAPNVAAGQKVVVATVGTTIYPTTGAPLTMKVAKIRGVESQGMICAEDEIGLGTSHEGILVLPGDAPVGTAAADYFKPYKDVIYEIGLTPNRMDAMSHWGVARDMCAYLSHHEGRTITAVIPHTHVTADNKSLPVEVVIENKEACKRYSGVTLSDITVQESPVWLQNKLKAIGLRPINNIVDITNFIQHETGQPLHAFDYEAVKGGKVVVKNLPENTVFTTLDERERKLSAEDLMICNAEEGMCIAGVFGGARSGVSDRTKTIFLESAYFDPAAIRKTSFRHGLRTDAATRFEKGIDISATLSVLERAAFLIKEVAGGVIASPFIDVYPDPRPKAEVVLTYGYLKKLSGKAYATQAVMGILKSLGFEIVNESTDALTVAVPYHKPDVRLPADVVEEILRIDGLDAIPIPTAITITPAVEEAYAAEALKEKLANVLTGMGFSEILTNSITNSKYASEGELQHTVRLLNNLSTELDVMRPSMLYTGLEVLQFNSNRKATDLRLFEWGKTYRTAGAGQYSEQAHLCLYVTGQRSGQGWKEKSSEADLFYLKGVVQALLKAVGISNQQFETGTHHGFQSALILKMGGENAVVLGQVAPEQCKAFDLKQPVYAADFLWDVVVKEATAEKITYREIPKYPAVERDLAVVVPEQTPYEAVENGVQNLRLGKLEQVRLFDVFQSEKLGPGKKSLAINFTFQDKEKTLTDKEIDGWMQKIMTALERDLGAEIRR